MVESGEPCAGNHVSPCCPVKAGYSVKYRIVSVFADNRVEISVRIVINRYAVVMSDPKPVILVFTYAADVVKFFPV